MKERSFFYKIKFSAKIAATALLLFLSLNCFCQETFNEPWSGLKEPQKVLPQGEASIVLPHKKPFVKKAARIEKIADYGQVKEWILRDGWILQQIKDNQEGTIVGDPINAIVPGTVLTSLVEAGHYPHPYFGLNNMAIPDSLSKMKWKYSITFDAPQGIEDEDVYLTFYGINYKSSISLNSTKIGETSGAFHRAIFEISSLLCDKDNLLEVTVFSLEHPGIPHEQSILDGQGLNGGATSYDGPTFISSVGWDWMPAIRDRNIGIWQEVRLISGGSLRIENPIIATDLPLPDTTKAAIYIETPIENVSGHVINGELVATIAKDGEKVVVRKSYSLYPDEVKNIVLSSEDCPELVIDDPNLWWPNGYGTQELYDLTLEAFDKESGYVLSDCKHFKFGIREFSYELMADSKKHGALRIEFNPLERYLQTPYNQRRAPFDNINKVLYNKEKSCYIPFLTDEVFSGIKEIDSQDPIGEKLVILVNGRRIFCRGGNWGMDDAMKRSSRERLEPYFALHKDLNFNIVRNWTGESTEEIFYTLADEYGMLVWNDFWMTGDDTVEPLDQNLFLINVEDVVKRFRYHPSIVIWGARNEGFAPIGLENRFAKLIANEDPTRHYHGQSRFLNMGTSGPWNYFSDPSYYFFERADGFNTEMGSFAIPTYSTLKKFIAPEDRWPINDVWAYHDLHFTSQNSAAFLEAVSSAAQMQLDDTLSFAGTAQSLACADAKMKQFADAAQGICYDAWRAMLEAWNSKMWNNTTGLILWMSHPAWPSMIWQTYTFDYETPGSFFGAKKACEPLHIQLSGDKKVEIVNSTLKTYDNLRAIATCYDEDGRMLFKTNGDWKAARRTTLHRGRVSNRGMNPERDEKLQKSKFASVEEFSDNNQLLFTAKANAVTKCYDLSLPADIGNSYMIRLELYNVENEVVSINDYIVGETFRNDNKRLNTVISVKIAPIDEIDVAEWKSVANSNNAIDIADATTVEKTNAVVGVQTDSGSAGVTAVHFVDADANEVLDANAAIGNMKKYSIKVKNTSNELITGIKLRALSIDGAEYREGMATGELQKYAATPILPSFFSDGYFNLLPYENREIMLSFPAGQLSDDKQLIVTIE